MKHAIYGIVRAWGVYPGQQWRFIYLCCILFCKCGVDHGMGSHITVYVWRVWNACFDVLQRHNLVWRVDRRMNRHTNWWMVWKLERLWDPPRGITNPLFPWKKIGLFPCSQRVENCFLMFHVPQYCLCTLFHSKFDLFSLFPWYKCHFACFPKPLGGTPLCGCHI